MESELSPTGLGDMIEKIQVILISIFVLGGLAYGYIHREEISVLSFFVPDIPMMRIGDIPVHVEIANSPEERARGLSGRKELDPVNGLLFVFSESDYHSMWMKDMNFPIDIIWIDENLTVVSIDKNVRPESYPRLFRPAKPALYAVETDIYFSDSLGISTGDKVKLPSGYLEN